MRWFVADIAEAVLARLTQQAQADDAEHAVYGIDARDELGLHPLIRAGLTNAGLGAWPEQRYPGHRHKRNKNTGLRCDLALTLDGAPLRDPAAGATLFDDGSACDPEAAYWLEVKTVAQFETDGPFRRYAAELLSPVAHDVKKICSDSVIQHGGLLLVLFTANPETAEHDLAAWHEYCLRKRFPVGPPAVRGLPLTDRIGNCWCTVAVFGIRGR